MELKEEKKKQMRKEAHVKEEIPVHVESPRNAIKGGSRWGRCSKNPRREFTVAEAKVNGC